ncbi:MAG: hypothetical protein RPU13_07635 [Candidatus Sedimenticola sp. (ex Thyasira tokunagai)]
MGVTLTIQNAVHKHTADHITLTVGDVIDKLKLTDKVANSEKTQLIRWFRERFDDLTTAIQDISEIINNLVTENIELSSNAIEFLKSLM